MTVLLLGGTGEARALSQRLTGLGVIASLAGVTRKPKPYGVPTRIGGFGGADGFRSFLKDEGVTAVIDATHPYAAQMPQRASAICGEMALPYLRLLRPAWRPQSGDQWQEVATLADAAAILPTNSTIFLATGGQSADHTKALHAHTIWLRRVDDTGPAPWPKGGVIVGLPSNDPQVEAALLQRHGITHIIAKNSGGPMGYAKLDAARTLGLPVILLSRPPVPDAPVTTSLDTAESFVKAHAS